jgi:thymidylate synthase ThyX
MGKKSRRDKPLKEKKLKDEPARIKAVEAAKSKIQSLGLSPEIDGIKEFYDKCDEYINSGEHYSGKINLNGFKRVLEYILPTNYQTDIGLVLKYDKNI